jgi:hypothetical protein
LRIFSQRLRPYRILSLENLSKSNRALLLKTEIAGLSMSRTQAANRAANAAAKTASALAVVKVHKSTRNTSTIFAATGP